MTAVWIRDYLGPELFARYVLNCPISTCRWCGAEVESALAKVDSTTGDCLCKRHWAKAEGVGTLAGRKVAGWDRDFREPWNPRR